MTANERIERKAKELYKMFYGEEPCSFNNLIFTEARDKWTYIAKAVILGELRSRIEVLEDIALCIKENMDIDTGEKIADLQRNIAELEGKEI